MSSPILIHRVIARLNIGGPAMHVVNLTRALNEGPFRTRLIAGLVPATEGDMAYYAEERGVEVTYIPELSREVSPLDDLRTLMHLYRLFKEERPRIVHTHTAKAGTLGRIAAAMAGVPVRIHTYHGHVLGGGYFSPIKTRAYLEIERQMARLSTRLVVLTERQAREMAGELRVAPREKLAVVPLGLELERFAEIDRDATRPRARQALGLEPDECVIGIVGRLVPVKNHELLFDAVAILEDRPGRRVRVLVVGSGERENELRRYAEGKGIADRVSWLGWRTDLPELYTAMDVLALTSMDEGTPVAVIEALATGTPVVCRGVGGVPELLEGGKWGRLVMESDPVSFADALQEALAKPEGSAAITERQSDILRRAEIRRLAAERFSVARLANDMAALYRAELG